VNSIGLLKKELPEGWLRIRLREVCQVNPPRPFVDRQDGAPTSFVPMSAVDDRAGIIARPEVRPYAEIKKGYTCFADGDVLFAKITPCMENGKHAIARGLSDGLGFGSTEFHVVRPRTDVCSEWIHFFLRQPHVLKNATNHFTGAVGQRRVPDSYLSDLELPLPPLSEQKRITGILDEQMEAVEQARAAIQAQLEAAKALQAAYFRQAFPQPDVSLPDGWRWMKLGEMCQGSGQYGTSQKSNGEQKGIPILGMYHIHEGRIRWLNVAHVDLPQNESFKYMLRCGDLLFNRTNSAELVGKTAVYDLDTEAVFASYLIRFRLIPERVSPYFVSMYINSQSGRKFIEKNMARAIGQVNISASTMSEMPIPAPAITEQQRITRLLKEQTANVDRFRVAAEAQLETINALPAALLRRAFNGEL